MKETEKTINTKDYTIRLEKKEEHRTVENLVRESFWNIYRPGCSEHYVIHVLRDDPAFVKELDFVMEKDGKLIGQNMFMKTMIESDDGREIPVRTMGLSFLRATSIFMAKAVLTMPAGLAYGIMICLRMRIPPSSSAKS